MAPPIHRTGDHEIDLDAREIRRAGVPVEVEAKVFDLIALLLANRDRALSKRELSAALWQDRPVTDAALSQLLRKARRALDDDGNRQRVIRTVHGHGLRWVAGVDVDAGTTPTPAASAPTPPPAPLQVASTPPDRRARRRWLIGAVALLVVAIALLVAWRMQAGRGDADLRLAVLPVEDRSGDAALDWTREGLMGLMVNLLAQRGDPLEVVAARDVRAVETPTQRAGDPDFAGVRRALGATHVVATRLRKLGTLYELDLRLVAGGAAERHETLHGGAPAALAIAAVDQVRRWLDLAALPDTRGRGIANPFLAEAYARGLAAQTAGDHPGALKYFAICLDQDPGLAWPRLGLAVSQGETGATAASEENATQVVAAAREQSDGELLVAALRQLASLAFRRGDLDGAALHLDAARRALPADHRELALTALLVAQASIDDERGRIDSSRALFEQALVLARASGNRRGEASVLVNLASLDNGAGDTAAAAAKLRAGLDAAREAGDRSLEAATLGNLGAVEANQGRMLDAVALLKQGVRLAAARGDPHLETLGLVQLGWALAPFGREGASRQVVSRIDRAATGDANAFWRAEAHWLRGDLAARQRDWPLALDELEQARSLYAASGMTRNLAPVLAQIVETACEAGLAERAHAAADAFRALVSADGSAFADRLPLIDAQLRKVDGDPAAALDALAHWLDANGDARGPAAQAALFQLGRWQLALGRYEDLLSRPAWKPWLEQHPDAIALRIAALRATGRTADADAEASRLQHLREAPELDLGALADAAP